MITLDALNARVRGLSSRLLTPEQLRDIASASGLRDLARRLDRLGYGASSEDISATGLEVRVRRLAAERLATLARWAVDRERTLRVIFEDEDRCSLRALIRGAVAGVLPRVRLAGSIPTPGLPLKALEELARQPTARDIAALLAVWGHPYGTPLLDEAARPEPDLLRLELRIARTFFARALDAARRTDALRKHVQELIDLENAGTALVSAGQLGALEIDECFISGGGDLDLERFTRVVRTDDAEEAAAALSTMLREGLLERVLRADGPPDVTRFEDRALDELIRERRAWARRDPLGVASVLLYALRARAEARDLRRVIWGMALGAAGGSLIQEMVVLDAR